jgi:hypothetical protein
MLKIRICPKFICVAALVVEETIFGWFCVKKCENPRQQAKSGANKLGHRRIDLNQHTLITQSNKSF